MGDNPIPPTRGRARGIGRGSGNDPNRSQPGSFAREPQQGRGGRGNFGRGERGPSEGNYNRGRGGDGGGRGGRGRGGDGRGGGGRGGDGVGRGRGGPRGRGQFREGQTSGLAPQPDTRTRDAPPPIASAWGPRPQQTRLPPQPIQQQPTQQTAVPPMGRSDRGEGASSSHSGRYEGAAAEGGNTAAEGGNTAPAKTRGSIRGNRVLHESVITTKPSLMVSKRGSSGTYVNLTANYFPLLKTTKFNLCLYSVEFTPSQDSTTVKKHLVNTALRANDSPFSGYIFDGTSLYTPIERLEYTKTVQDERSAGDNSDGMVVVKLSKVKMLQAGDYQYIQLFNIIMRKCLQHLNLALVGRNYYDPAALVRLTQLAFDLWPGYITSIRQHEDAVLMCAEISHKVMRHDTALTKYNEYYSHSDQRYRRLFTEEMLNTVVLTDYNNRTYTITDVDYSQNPNSTFPKKDGTVITYVEYFWVKYRTTITNLNQPLLVSRSSLREIRAGMNEVIFLVPELCRLTGLTDAQKANFNLMRALAENTRVGPPARIQKLLQFSRRLTGNERVMEELRRWNMELANNLVKIQGRVLPPESIHGAGNKSYSAGEDADWTRQLRDKPMTSTATLKNWVVIYTYKDKRNIEQFIGNMRKAASAMYFNMPQPQYLELPDDRVASYLSGLERVANQANPPTMIFAVVPNNKSDRYTAIKKKCYIDRAILCQVLVGKNMVAKGAMSIATKVVIQMNAKLGGVPWSLHMPLTRLMVIGFDVCHDPQRRDRRYGAFVASIDESMGHYYSVVRNHPRDEELSTEFAINMKGALNKYKQINGVYPDRIMIYRDGVGEGQLNQVIKVELTNLFNECEHIVTKPKVTFIVVSKRINTRIFDERQNNPKPGTVVDSVVTLPERYDFFIVSQCVRQGTVSPTNYNVIKDESGLAPDQLQRLTYKMTHLYFNWSGTVRVPAPCQYAHKLAFLAGQHLHQNAHRSLENSLYYL